MASFIETTLKDIDERLQDLRQQLNRLEAARAALAGRGTARSRRSAAPARRATTRRRRSAPRGRRAGGTRANQALELVRKHPGITIPDIAKQMSIQPNYLYRVLPRLAQEGLVKRDGQGWHPVS
jgi:predicted Rossmann fold nucleotide-binding protein DprA/Smf involved in DNA uptake